MLFSYNLLKEHIKRTLPSPDKLEQLLNMHIFEVEEKEKKKNDWIFDIAMLPHRGDAMGHYGLARELAALLSLGLKPLPQKLLQAKKGGLPQLKVRLQSPAVFRYSAVVLEGVRIAKSPQWLQDRLHLLGINSINNVVDATNYVMVELGQPLHAFDYDTLRDHQMLIRGAKEGERIETLDDLNFKLPKDTLVIEDKNRLIDLAGIKGGKYSGIQPGTKNVVLQAATFSGKQIYKTKKQLGYTTPAADLYTHELDPNATIETLKRAVELLGTGRVVQIIDLYPKKRVARKLLFDTALLAQYLGVVISKTMVKQILQRLGCKVQNQKKGFWVTVPTFRQDLKISEDLVEEVGRMQGYEKIAPAFPVAALTPSLENPVVRLRERLQDALVEAGYTEIYNYSFVGEKDLTSFAYTKKDTEALVQLENPFSEEYKYLRPNLIENLLKVIEENKRRSFASDIRVFELGKVFKKEHGKIQEHDLVCGVLALSQKDDQKAFAQGKGLLDFVLGRLGIAAAWYDAFQQTPLHSRVSLWHEKKMAEIKVGKAKIGFLGIIAPHIGANLKLKGSLIAFAFDIQGMLPLLEDTRVYKPIPRFPAVYRDLAVLVPSDTKIADVMNRMHATETKLIDDIDLFDMYEGEGIPDGKKNLAFHLIYQSPAKTLTATEVDKIHEKIITALEKNPMWEVRK